jgi:UDP-3-O-[3-hydroxymyristoyl] glucosamine N-acyltransferase
MAGGQAGIAGHLKIGSGAKIAGQSGVMRDLPPKAEVMGTPAVPLRQFMRQATLLSKMVVKGQGSDDDTQG